MEIDPSVTGMQGKNLPWFWTMNTKLEAGNWMSECEFACVLNLLADRKTDSSLGKIPLGKGECRLLHQRSSATEDGDAMGGEFPPASQRQVEAICRRSRSKAGHGEGMFFQEAGKDLGNFA